MLKMLDTLLTTLIREMQNLTVAKRKCEALLATRRFVRSVIRIFIVKTVELNPESQRPLRRLVPSRCSLRQTRLPYSSKILYVLHK